MAKDSAPRPPVAPLSRREREIMDVLYAKGEATVNDVVAALTDPPSYSAVRATLNVLVTKGHATIRQDGPRYAYLPSVPANRARTAAIRHVVRTFFGGSSEDAVMALLEMSDTRLPRSVVDRLTREIDRARREGR